MTTHAPPLRPAPARAAAARGAAPRRTPRARHPCSSRRTRARGSRCCSARRCSGSASSTSWRSCCCSSPRSGRSTASPARSDRRGRSTTSSRRSPGRCTRRSPCARSASPSLVTLIDVALALPIAFFMAKVASPRMQRILVIAVLTPLWASYLVKAYAWRSVLSQDGILEWLLAPFGLAHARLRPAGDDHHAGVPLAAVRDPADLRRARARARLAARGIRRSRRHDLADAAHWSCFPLLLPAIIAGTIFSFSLSLGDYITVNIVGGANQMLGNLVYTNVGAANNLPLAAAIALIPIVIIFGYLVARAPHRRPRQPLGRRMRLSPNRPHDARRRHRPHPGRRVRAAVRRAGQLVLDVDVAHLAAAGLHARVVGPGVPERRRHGGGADQRAGRGRRDDHLARARHAHLARAAAVLVLRPRRDQPAGHPADRAAGHHHRHRAQQLLPHDHGRAAVDLDGRRSRTPRSASSRCSTT